MKISKRQYEFAKKNVGRLRKFQAVVTAWEDAVKSVEDHMAGMDVVEVLIDDETKQVSVRSVKSEEGERAADSGTSRGAA